LHLRLLWWTMRHKVSQPDGQNPETFQTFQFKLFGQLFETIRDGRLKIFLPKNLAKMLAYFLRLKLVFQKKKWS
jgi:hypothetical protein